MSNRTWRLRGGVGILLASLVCLCVGCNPQSLSMLLMPFADNKVEPEHNLFAGKKELKLVILTRFAEQDLLQCDEIVPTETELPNQLALYFKKRCAENRLKINIVPQSEVRNYLDKEGITGEDLSSLTLDIGKHFKADYVLNLNIQSLHLINRKFNPPVYQGRAHIFVSLYKVSASEAEAKVFTKNFTYGYPSENNILPEVPRNADAAEFRNMFLFRVARDISKMFIAFDPDERRVVE